MRYALAAGDIARESKLSCQETRDFIKTDKAMELQITACSGGLLEVVEVSGRDATGLLFRTRQIQVIHQSVGDYLTSQGLKLLADLSDVALEVPEKYHGKLYRSCLDYISVLDNAELEFFHKHVPKMQGLQTEKHSFLLYAIFNTLEHARKAKSHRGIPLEKERQLLIQAIPLWARAGKLLWHWHLCPIPPVRAGMMILHVAAYATMVDLVQYLLSRDDAKASINNISEDGTTALHNAAEQGHLALVQILSAAGASIHTPSDDLGTPLMIAARRGYTDLFRWLLSQGASPDTTNFATGSYDEGLLANVLYAMAYEGNVVFAQLCVNAGADLNAISGSYGPALAIAAHRGHEKIVRLLINAGAEVDKSGGVHGTAIVVASLEGHEKVVRLLIEAGANVNAWGKKQSALIGASSKGHGHVVQLLIAAGADVNAQRGIHDNALVAAALCGSTAIVHLLIKAGATLNAPSYRDGTALGAASHEDHGKVVKLLIDAGVDVNFQNGGPVGTALDAASRRGHKAMIKLLLEAGANVSARGGKYGTAIAAASFHRERDTVQFLIDNGADVNIPAGDYNQVLWSRRFKSKMAVTRLPNKTYSDKSAEGQELEFPVLATAFSLSSTGQRTAPAPPLVENEADVGIQAGKYGNALHAAIASILGPGEAVVQLLLEAGADVDARKGSAFNTPLQEACSRDTSGIVLMLIRAGADVNVQGGESGSPLQVASSKGSTQTVQLLLAAGADVNQRGTAEVCAQYPLRHCTPLQLASYCDNTEVMELLLKAGADANAPGGSHGTALQAALSQGNDDAVRILRAAGVRSPDASAE